MHIRVQLQGTGADGDPYYVDLPTYQMLRVDYAGKRAIVDVPPDTLPPALASQFAINTDPQIADPADARDLSDFYLAWRKHLRRKYANVQRDYTLRVL